MCIINRKLIIAIDSFASFIIACNGAIIRDIKTKEDIYKNSFTNKEILKFRKMYQEENADYMMLYTDEQAITEAKEEQAMQKAGVNVKEKKVKAQNIQEIITENTNLTNLLCLIGGEVSALEKIIEKLSTFDDIEHSVICNYLYKTENHTFESKYIDITKKGCSKKRVIHILADKLGIKQEEIIVMGDGGNDISMFEGAGLKIAMENAEPYLKENADYITASNNDSGVAKAIQKFIFNEE